MAKPPKPKDISSLTHDAARRINNPTAEMASLYEQQEEQMRTRWKAMRVPRDRPLARGEVRDRDGDLDPQIVWNGVKITLTPAQVQQLGETGTIEIGDAQLVWRGKDTQDWSDLVVNAPPLYIQEKVHPKAIIDDLKRRSQVSRERTSNEPSMFDDFNGLADPEARAEFYRHPMHWQNRFILGDSLQVMASLAQREGLKGRVQAIYFDPPYGIKFNSNWQVSTLSRDVKDGKQADITREPEQVKAFRDTWKDGIHSYLTYLRDRLTVARELLTESGSIFVQIGDENVHRVRALMDEVFGAENAITTIVVEKTSGASMRFLDSVADHVLWYGRSKDFTKYRQSFELKAIEDFDYEYKFRQDVAGYRDPDARFARGQAADRVYAVKPLTSQTDASTTRYDYTFRGTRYASGKRQWATPIAGMDRLTRANRVEQRASNIGFVRFFDDFPVVPRSNIWTDTGTGSFTDDKVYVVQTGAKVVQRCLLMATDPGDLVLDPTCGSGTTATVAEQWGRRWITIDTSRVALALARTRLMSARYPYYLLADSPEGRAQEGKLTGRIPSDTPTGNDIRQGFVCERAPHITLKSIVNNAEIDIIWERWQAVLEQLRAELNAALVSGGVAWEEWQIPRDLDVFLDSKEGKPLAGLVSAKVRELHAKWWETRIARQQEIDASIARAADVELLYDRPYEDKSRVRVAGPFTVESLSPHRVVTARDESLGDAIAAAEGTLQPDPANVPEADFGAMVLENLKAAGVHQKDKADAIRFNSLEPWPGKWIAAEGRYTDGDGRERRAGILIGPEFGTLTRSQITAAAREASEARFDALIATAFNFEAQATDLDRLGPLPIIKARMNPDLHMSDELKSTGKGNLFVVFGEPDITLMDTPEGEIRVKVNGVDVFDPSTGEIRSDGKDGIAAWFIDTDYNEESFFVRHAYFLGGGSDPYKSLKTALRAEIDEDAWATLYSDVSRPFARPKTGRIAVKVINHFGDEVLKVFGV
jgi:adenine-specific DNA-methyltransferase